MQTAMQASKPNSKVSLMKPPSSAMMPEGYRIAVLTETLSALYDEVV
jgi:hypothetical protein